MRLMQMPEWFINASAIGFWVLFTILGLGAIITQREGRKIRKVIEAEIGKTIPDSWNNWGWVVDESEEGIGQPMLVPPDMVKKAIKVLNEETLADQQKMRAEQWRWVVDPLAIRYAMLIAQETPDIEEALITWVANHTKAPVPDDDDDDRAGP